MCRELQKTFQNVKVITGLNYGPSHARNLGLDNARGKYIMFCDSDDFVSKEWTKLLYEESVSHVDRVLVVSKFSTVHENEIQNVGENVEENEIKILGKEALTELYLNNYLGSPCNKIYQKSVLDKYSIRFDEKINLFEDLIFNLQYFCYMDKIIILSKSLYFYIQYAQDSLSKTYKENYMDCICAAYNTMVKTMRKMEIEMDIVVQIHFYHLFLNCLNNTKMLFGNINDVCRVNDKILQKKEFHECVEAYYQTSRKNICYFVLKTKKYKLVDRYLRLATYLKGKKND